MLKLQTCLAVAFVMATTLFGAGSWSDAANAADERSFFCLDLKNVPNGPLNESSLSGCRVEASPPGVVAVHIKKGDPTETRLLHIQSGDNVTCTLHFSEPVLTERIFFHLERWTSRSPFDFKVDVNVAAGWKEIQHLDAKYPVGDNQPPCSLSLGSAQSVRAIRFTVTSPPDSGVLIRGLTLASGPLRLASGEIPPLEQIVTPLLIRGGGTTVEAIPLELVGSDEVVGTNQVCVALRNTAALQSARIECGDKQIQITPLQDGVAVVPITKILSAGSQPLRLVLEPRPDADLDAKVSGGITEITIGDKTQTFPPHNVSWRIGYLLVAPNQTMQVDTRQQKVHTFRIPGIAVTNSGTLLAVYDVRHRNAGDLPADIDVGISRSTDRGTTWEEPRIIIDCGTGDAKEGVGDPAILVDRKTGRIWVAALWAHNGRSLAKSESGLELGKSGQFVLSWSDDDGKTWSPPRNITSEIGAPSDARIVFNGPGGGITMQNGTLVFAAQYWDASGIPHATILSSRDHGETWQLGTSAHRNTTEAQVAELADGVLMLNMRTNGARARSVAVTNDFGKTWTQHPTSGKSLVEPVCQASLLRLTRRDAGAPHDSLIFFNPKSQTARSHMTLQVSDDDGMTWTRQLLVYTPRCYGYSSIDLIDPQTLAIVYETEGGLIFQRIPIADVK
ncbi:MAG: sialidase family protein [Thermoguttaceae bacterium]